MSAGLTMGARAALELRLQDAKHDLQLAIEQKNANTHQADVCRALADENACERVRYNAAAIKYRLRAAGMDAEIASCRGRVAMLEGMLKDEPTQDAPAVLTAEQVAAMDECAGVSA